MAVAAVARATMSGNNLDRFDSSASASARLTGFSSAFPLITYSSVSVRFLYGLFTMKSLVTGQSPCVNKRFTPNRPGRTIGNRDDQFIEGEVAGRP